MAPRGVSDIPGLEVSSGLLLAVAPGGVFVVEGAGFEAAVKDADEPVGETSQGVVVADAAGAALVVAGAGTGGEGQGGERLGAEGIDEPAVAHGPGRDGLPPAGGAGDRAGAGVVA